ncbi:MAG TPA: hypothetical protein VMU99_10245 [Acidimicrobiales bacterium]|nr:hypothetical protein [Acidimicrobiales bacterium]
MNDRMWWSPPNHRWRYSRFDGRSDPIAFDANDVLAGLADDLLYHGDPSAALRALLREGFDGAGGERVSGLSEIMNKIAQRRSQLSSDDNDLALRVFKEIEEIVSLEQMALAGRKDEQALMQAMQLELLPDGLVEKIEGLLEYPFVSRQAKDRFEQLLEELRRDMVQNQLDQFASQLAGASPEDQAHLRDGLDSLNQLIERRANGENVDGEFESFLESFGDLFPGDPKSLDDLILQLSYRMAAASQMMSAMSPSQRAKFDQLSERLLSDIDIAWQMDRLSANLRDAFPDLKWEQYPKGEVRDPISLLGNTEQISELAELESIERQLRQAANPDALREIDFERVEQILGGDVARSMRALADLTKRLEEAGLIGRKEGKLQLTPAGVRRLGSHALQELFARLRRDRVGNHPIASVGIGHDRAFETKPYEFGDPFRIDLQQTLRNAIVRNSANGGESPRFPVKLRYEDFEVEQSEQITAASTVLAIDLSLSMPMEDNFLAAKKVAIALQSLIASRYPRDYLGLIGFSATAREIEARDLPGVSWDFAYGTNLQHALMLSRKILGHQTGAKQVIVITDGEPTAHIDDLGEVFFQYPAVPETIERTMLEVQRCTKDQIVINTFVLNSTGALRSFVDRMTRVNRGRAFYTSPEELGDYVLVDFVANHTSRTQKRLQRGA